MKKTLQQTVRELCLAFPETAESVSHGSTTFKVRGKTFAYFLVNHHGDGRVALWINAAAGIQELQVSEDPQRFFVPPYLGHRGWLGIALDQGLPWTMIAALAHGAYQKVAPRALAHAATIPRVKAPPAMDKADIDPLQSAAGLKLLQTLRAICLGLPETSESRQFGHPVWLAGKRTFAQARARDRRIEACFWVGVDQQPLLIVDPRYEIPPYQGHTGWIALDVSRGHDRTELEGLAQHSYRHFALQRMLRRLA